eukprot:1129080-Rhodomonas_salina.2
MVAGPDLQPDDGARRNAGTRVWSAGGDGPRRSWRHRRDRQHHPARRPHRDPRRAARQHAHHARRFLHARRRSPQCVSRFLLSAFRARPRALLACVGLVLLLCAVGDFAVDVVVGLVLVLVLVRVPVAVPVPVPAHASPRHVHLFTPTRAPSPSHATHAALCPTIFNLGSRWLYLPGNRATAAGCDLLVGPHMLFEQATYQSERWVGLRAKRARFARRKRDVQEPYLWLVRALGPGDLASV